MQPFSDKTTIAIPGEPGRAERLAAVLDRYMCELEAGGIPPDLDALVAAHPDLADELRSYADSLKLLHQMTASLRSPSATSASRPATPAVGDMPTKRLGDYDILREIGRGGMGIVYEARQLSLNRHVALKVLPFAAMLDERQIARFRNEAQAAAQLHHPNIVPVYAVGQERGVHYFAMQFVPGQSLEAALQELRGDAAPLAEDGAPVSATLRLGDTAPFGAFSTRASTHSRGYCHSVARLMIQAADAIQHAHEYGVVHRDVKPSNLLLDRHGKLWVTDFGLARMQSDSGVTMTGDVVGTLRYMSPEQAAGATALVDARADVYSLGAALYELLTLRPAHSGDNRQEVLRNIERREPTPPRQLNSAIPLDLETITLRAMAKGRDERYATANDFANDLRLFLEGKPTVARRPTIVDRTAKWALRHRRAVLLAAGCLLVLAVVSATAAVLIARAKSRTDAALVEVKQSLKRENESWKQAENVVDFFSSGIAGLSEVPGIEPHRQAWLNKTLGYYRNLIARTADDPRLRGELAEASFKAAAISESLGHRREAIALCRQAIAEFDKLVQESPNNAKLQLQQAKCHGSLGLLLAADGDVDGALAAYRQAIQRQEQLASRSDAPASAVQELADTYGKLGLLLGELGRKDQARHALETAIRTIEQLVERRPDDLSLRHDLALTYNSLSFVEREHDWPRAEECCQQAIEILERLVEKQGASAAYRADLALCQNNLGALLGRRAAWGEAAEAFDRAIALQEQLRRQSPAVVNYRRDLAVSWNNLGDARSAAGDDAGAIEAYDHAEEIIAVLVDDFPDELSYRGLLGAVLNNRATRLEAAGDLDAALAAYERGVAEQRAAFEKAPQLAVYRNALSKHYYNYGRALRRAGQPGLAGEAAIARRALWTGEGSHLVQVAVEIAHAAAEVRRQAALSDADEQADRLEAEVAATLREAQAAGAELAALQNETIFQSLQDRTIWTTIKGSNSKPN